MADKKPTHRSLDRALQILMIFSPSNRLMGLSEISKRTGIHPSTVSRLLHVLSNRGFVEQDEDTKKFVLGKTIADLGRAFFRSLQDNLVVIARPIIDNLSTQLKETIALEIWSGNGTLLSYRTRAAHMLQVSGEIGTRLPAHAAAGAKAILAYSETHFVNRILKKELETLTSNTITDPEVLRERLNEIKRDGVSFDREEMAPGVFAIGAPVFDAGGKAMAALVLTFPINRSEICNNAKNISKLKSAAEEISSLLIHSSE